MYITIIRDSEIAMGKAAMGSASFCMLINARKKMDARKAQGCVSKKYICFVKPKGKADNSVVDENCLMFSLLLFNGCCFEEY
jgi:hypothetical protein